MTTPPPGATSGFESGDDFVAARVSIDIPTEGIAGLREITQEMDRFRTSVESANRSSETFSGYLTRIAEAAQQAATAQENLVAMLERSISAQNSAAVAGAGGGPQPQLNAPAQYTNPFASATLGMGPADYGGMGGDIPSQLAALQTQNPRAFINKMAASGQYRMGDIGAASPNMADIQSAAGRISQRAQLLQEGAEGMGDIGSRSGRMGAMAQQVLNEINPGANPLGVPGMVQRGLGAMGRLGGDGLLGGLGGSLGTGLARMAGPAGLALGVGMAGYGLVQGAGGIYQDYKNMGLIRGGGAVEGVGYEIGIRTMAMNPFISGDQARQIMQQGLRDGYTGKEFDTITGMVAQNLKDFNMEVGASFQALRKNVIEGGQSPGAFMSNMESLKQLSAQGYRSLPELQAGYVNTSSSLISAGVTGNVAGQSALALGQLFSNNPVLAGEGETIGQMFANSPMAMSMMRLQGGVDLPSGVLPGALPLVLGEGQLEEGAMNTLKYQAMRIWTSLGKPAKAKGKAYANAVSIFQKRLQMLGLPYDMQKARELFDQLVYPGGDTVGAAQDRIEESQRQQTEVRERNPASMSGSTIISGLSAVGSGMLDVIGNVGGTIKDVFTDNTGNIDDRWKAVGDRMAGRDDYSMAGSGRYYIDALNSVRDAYSKTGGIEVVDASEQVQKLDYSNREQMQRLSSGELKVRQRGGSGPGVALRDIPTDPEAVKTALGGTGGKSQVSGQVTIDLTPDAKRVLKVQGGPTIQLNPHEQQANRSYGQATPNNAPPGYERR